MNSGVYALTQNSLTSVHMKELEEKGVDIFACKTCVDHYEVESILAAGKISSMAHFIELVSRE